VAEWAKLHTDILGDRKLMRAARHGAVGLEYTPWLFAFAKEADDDGRLTVNGEPAEPDDLAALIPCSTADRIAGCLAALTELEVLVTGADGALRFARWGPRQSKPSKAAPAVLNRVHKHRDKQRVRKVVSVTPDVGVTPVTPVTPRCNATEGEEEEEGEEEKNNSQPPHGGSVAVVVHMNGHAKAKPHGSRGLPAVIDRGRQAIADLLAMGEEEAQTDRQRAAMVALVFAYWAARLKHPGALQDQKRERLIATRLRENRHDVSELLYAVDGAKRDRNLMGENERGRKYDGIETIFRDRGQVERLAQLGRYTAGAIHPQLAALTEPAGATP
jgi:hypothetical protein